MPYDTLLADKIRDYLSAYNHLIIEEKEMFRGLTFMVNGKMCVSVSGDKMMCRFDPALQEEVAEKNGYEPMLMKGKELKGYCYVDPIGFQHKKDFTWWIDLCIAYNPKAKASRK